MSLETFERRELVNQIRPSVVITQALYEKCDELIRLALRISLHREAPQFTLLCEYLLPRGLRQIDLPELDALRVELLRCLGAAGGVDGGLLALALVGAHLGRRGFSLGAPLLAACRIRARFLARRRCRHGSLRHSRRHLSRTPLESKN